MNQLSNARDVINGDAPECTDLSPDIHKLLGKWGNLHWYCKACEVLIKAFCNQGDTDMQSSISNTDISEARSLRLEGMMAKLEKRMDGLLVKNEEVVKSYAQIAKTNLPNKQPPSGLNVSDQKNPSLEKQTVKILDEYTDRERRKANIVIHNLPESTEEQRTDKLYDDTKRVNDLIQEGVDVPGVKVTRLIRLGGRGQNQQDKPRLILATLDCPDRRRAILATARMLRHTEEWSNIYISPDVTPAERQKDKKLRDELKVRRDAGEPNLIIRGDMLVTRSTRNEQSQIPSQSQATGEDIGVTDGTEEDATEITEAVNNK